MSSAVAPLSRCAFIVGDSIGKRVKGGHFRIIKSAKKYHSNFNFNEKEEEEKDEEGKTFDMARRAPSSAEFSKFSFKFTGNTFSKKISKNDRVSSIQFCYEHSKL